MRRALVVTSVLVVAFAVSGTGSALAVAREGVQVEARLDRSEVPKGSAVVVSGQVTRGGRPLADQFVVVCFTPDLKVKEKGNRTKCSSNLRSDGQGDFSVPVVIDESGDVSVGLAGRPRGTRHLVGHVSLIK
jgi:hypothetical protein